MHEMDTNSYNPLYYWMLLVKRCLHKTEITRTENKAICIYLGLFKMKTE